MKYISLILVFLISGLAHADNLSDASAQLCEKIKACGVEEMKAEDDMPAEMMEMMTFMYEGLCETIISPYIVKTEDANLQDKAVACLDTINEMSCTDLMDGAGEEAEPCIEFQDAAEEAGLVESKAD